MDCNPQLTSQSDKIAMAHSKKMLYYIIVTGRCFFNSKRFCIKDTENCSKGLFAEDLFIKNSIVTTYPIPMEENTFGSIADVTPEFILEEGTGNYVPLLGGENIGLAMFINSRDSLEGVANCKMDFVTVWDPKKRRFVKYKCVIATRDVLAKEQLTVPYHLGTAFAHERRENDSVTERLSGNGSEVPNLPTRRLTRMKRTLHKNICAEGMELDSGARKCFANGVAQIKGKRNRTQQVVEADMCVQMKKKRGPGKKRKLEFDCVLALGMSEVNNLKEAKKKKRPKKPNTVEAVAVVKAVVTTHEKSELKKDLPKLKAHLESEFAKEKESIEAKFASQLKDQRKDWEAESEKELAKQKAHLESEFAKEKESIEAKFASLLKDKQNELEAEFAAKLLKEIQNHANMLTICELRLAVAHTAAQSEMAKYASALEVEIMALNQQLAPFLSARDHATMISEVVAEGNMNQEAMTQWTQRKSIQQLRPSMTSQIRNTSRLGSLPVAVSPTTWNFSPPPAAIPLETLPALPPPTTLPALLPGPISLALPAPAPPIHQLKTEHTGPT